MKPSRLEGHEEAEVVSAVSFWVGFFKNIIKEVADIQCMDSITFVSMYLLFFIS